MDRAFLFSHSTMTSCFACVGFVLKGCLEILDLVARTLGLQREQLRVSHTDSIPSDEDYAAGSILNDADSIPSNAGSISNDADSIPSDEGSISNVAGYISNVAESIPGDEDYDAGSISNVAEYIPGDEDYDAGSISNVAESIPSDACSISNVAESIPSDARSISNDADSIPSDAGSISNDADSIPSDAGSISNVAESIPSDEDYAAGSILNDADSIPSDSGSISNDADSIPGDTNSVAAVTLFEHCRDAATAVRSKCERVRFNKSLCRLLADTYARYLPSDFDFTYTNKCQTILAELRRVISCGEMFVEQWTDKDWWMSVVSSSDSASIKERVVLHLNEFLFCVKVLRLIASKGAVPEGTSFMPLDLSMPDVEEGSRRDTERLFRIVEGYKAKSVAHGAVEKLAELALNKLSATMSDPGHLQSIEYDDVQLAGFLGRGSAGSVFECRFHGQMAAAKIIDDLAEVEAKLQTRLRHPNVVQFIGYAVKQKQYIIVMELMKMDLRRYLEENVHESQSGPPLPLLLALDIMVQLAEAMNYLHKSEVMHRDLKSANVLINVVENKESYIFPSVQVKLTDFGISKLNLNNSRFATMGVGTAQWRAPEVFPFGPRNKYTKAADVYSYAMVFFEVLTGEMPFKNIKRQELLSSICNGVRPTLPPDDYCPVHVSAVIKKCWATRPEDRPQFHEICQMLWQCKARILSHSSPHSSPWKSEPQKHRNDGGDMGGIVTTGNSENMFQGPGMMADINAGGFRATIDYNDVQIEKERLGDGGYASVYKCKVSGKIAAAKMFFLSKTSDIEAVKNEAKLLASFQHPNVVQFVGYAVNEKRHYIITELMSKDLRMYLKENVPLSLPLAVDIMLQIAEGMKYLHESGVMHRDLKADNVLTNVVENESYISPSVQVKLTDFGMSKLNLNNSRFTTLGVGAAWWRAPEVFKDKQNTEKYTNAADVYSFALVFFEVLTGEVPFAEISKSQILGKICGGEMPILPPDDYCPWPLSAFIRECWARRPEDRPRFPEICKRLQECKDKILNHSTPNASSQNSTP